MAKAPISAQTAVDWSSTTEAKSLTEAVDRWASKALPCTLVVARADGGQPSAQATSALASIVGLTAKKVSPEAVVASANGHVLAAFPLSSEGWLAQWANDARKRFAAEGGGTASLGYSTGTSESGERLLRLAERGLARARRYGGNHVAEAPRLVVVAGGLNQLMHATKGILARLDIEVQRQDSAEQVIEMLSHERPAVAVVNLLGPRHLLDEIAELRKRKEHAGMHVVLVTSKGPDPKYEAVAGRVPGATLVQGEVRLVPRVVEVVSQVLGIRPRRHLRVDPATNVQVTAVEKDAGAGKTFAGRLVDLSESGAKIAVASGEFAVDQPLVLAFKLDHQLLSVKASVARTYVVEGSDREYGVQFDDIDADAATAIADFVLADLKQPPMVPKPLAPEPDDDETFEAEPIRATPRVKVPKPLTLKARVKPQNGTKITYLKVLDMSEGGFLLVAPRRVNPPFTVGDVVEAFVFGEDTSLHCTAEVMRKAKPNIEDSWQIGFRFLSLSREDRAARAKALYRLSG